MTDGFSDPSPADGTDAPDRLTVTDDDDVEVATNFGASCEDCVHKPTCKYLDGWESLLESDDETPFDPAELAVVCDEYTPKNDG